MRRRRVSRGVKKASGAAAGLLTSGDLTWLGRFLLPAYESSNHDYGYSDAALTGFWANDTITLITTGKSHEAGKTDRPLEFTYPGYSTSSTLADLPRSTTTGADWTDSHNAKLDVSTEAGRSPEVRGLHFENGWLYIAYGDEYNTAGIHFPSIVAVRQSDKVAFGPWRTREHANKTRGYFCAIPSTFATNYTGGKTIAVGSPLVSGAASGNIGAGLFVLPTFDPATLPASTSGSTTVALETSTLIAYTTANPMARTGDYKICEYPPGPDYTCASSGATVQPGPPNFANGQHYSEASGVIRDKVTACAWIKTATKEGVLFIAEVTKALPGEVYPTDDMPHLRYGPSTTCCHGHVANNNQGTGPNSQTQVPVGYIFNPVDLAQVASSQLPSSALDWAEEFDLNPIDPQIPRNSSAAAYNIGGLYFNAERNLLFLTETIADNVTHAFNPRAIMHVFQVAG